MKTDKKDVLAMLIIAITMIVGVVGGDVIPDSEYTMESAFGIGAIIGGILSAASAAASAGVGGAQAAKAKKEQEKAEKELDNWYANEMAGNILDRADSRSMLNAYRTTMEEQSRKYANNAIKGGASEEAQVAYAQAANKGYADAISKISAQGQQRKDRVTDSYLQGKMDAFTKMYDLYMQSGQTMANTISSAGNSAASVFAGTDLGSIGKGGYIPPQK